MEKNCYITKICLDIIFPKWDGTNISDLGIKKEQIINTVVDDGKIYLIYWVDIPAHPEEGDILIAVDRCVMDDGSNTLTIGNQYDVLYISDGRLTINDDDMVEHSFYLDPKSDSYYGIFFKHKI